MALLLAAVALASGCWSAPDVPLSPVYRLTAALDPPLAKDVPPSCDVADEFRPAIGCLPFVQMLRTTVPRPATAEVPVSAEVPPALRGGMMVVEPRVRGARGDWQRVPSTVAPQPKGARADFVVPIPATVKGDEINVQVFGRPIPPSEQGFTTRPLKIGRGALLSVGLGLNPLAAEVGASPVEFRLEAETADGTRELITKTLDPLHDAGWSDHDVDLAALAGQTVSFRLATRVVPRAGADPAASFGLPLWGAPQVLEPRRRDGRRNIVLVSLDTLRGDHVGGSLEGIPLMPELARIAERGTAFENAFSAYPSTSASHMTMFTGLYPSKHQVVFATHTLSPKIHTLPEILAANGYSTVGVTEDAMLAAHAGFMRGFDYYREFKGKNMWDTAGQIEQTFGTGLRWIEQHPDQRFFLFLHTYEVHVPYEPPAEYDLFKTWTRDGEQLPVDGTTPKMIVSRNRYAGEARYADVVVKRLFDELAALGVLDDTIVVVTSDHGDEFGEHGLIGHAKTAYDEVLHVPLIIVAPGVVPRDKRIASPVSLVDLMPTLLSLVHVAPPAGVQGRSLLPLLRGDPFPQQRVLYAEAPAWGTNGGRRISARVADFKWIATEHDGAPVEIYDLATDPGEKKRLDDGVLQRIGHDLVSAYTGAGAPAPAAPTGDPLAEPKPELDERTVEKLKLLGYVD